MGNCIRKLTVCFAGGRHRKKQDITVLLTEPLDEGHGHSFCYVRPDPTRLSSSKVHSEENTTTTTTTTTTTFRTISGASVSANASTPLSTAFLDAYSYGGSVAAAFESSTSFASLPLQPVPRGLTNSGPFSGNIPGSGPLERGFMSGPIERGFMSGPITDRVGLFSGPIENTGSSDQFQRSFSYGGFGFGPRTSKGRWIRVLQRALSKSTKTLLSRGQSSIVAPIRGGSTVKELEWVLGQDRNPHHHNENLTVSSVNFSSDGSLEDDDSMESQNLQWAQGKAGEDRVHVVVSDENGWVFVGIYDGFNGPDAPDYLLSNLYSAVHKELKGLLWDDGGGGGGCEQVSSAAAPEEEQEENLNFEMRDSVLDGDGDGDVREESSCSRCFEAENHPSASGVGSFDDQVSKRKGGKKSSYKGAAKKWEENQRRWRCEWDRERLELDRRLKEQLNHHRSGSGCSGGGSAIDHSEVLGALSEALRKTEESYLDVADNMVMENPELALMGSCVLVMLMKGEDVYVMNVGDSRAVLAQKAEPDYWLGKIRQDLEKINEETMNDLESWDGDGSSLVPTLSAVQLTKDHSTNVDEEVQRIRREHPDDACAVVNERVKGSLKVTRAFGAGFLKQPKWNNALLEMFRIDYIGTSPYISCQPYLKHHKLGPKDNFLILSSDGLYQYLTNEEAVAEVELFITLQPEGDPAQHLVEEVLFRAAKKAGLDFHELLEIPQGDRRRYHDDVSIIVISFEGRIWRSCVQV